MLSASLLVVENSDSPASSCLKELLPHRHVHISTKCCAPLQLSGSVSISDSCILDIDPVPLAFLFLVASLQELRDHLVNASCNSMWWNPAAWTVVMFCSGVEPYLREQLARDAFKILWQYSVYNSALLVGENSVYRADPFSENNKCGREMFDIFEANCSYYRYPERIRFPNCDFLVSARESFPFSFLRQGVYIGSDVKLARLIASRSGLRISWSSRPSPQSTTTGSEAHAYYYNVSRNELDLAIGGSVFSVNYFFNVTYGFSHATQHLQFYVPNGKELRGWRRLVGMFSVTLWTVILITVGVCVTALSIFGPKGISNYFMLVFAIMLQVTVRLPTRKLRILLLSIVLPFYWLSFTYSTYLHSFTMNPPNYYPINTVKDIIKKNITVMVSATNHMITSKVPTRLVRKALSNIVISPGLKESAELLNSKRNFVLLERDLAMQFLIKKKGYNIHSISYRVTTLKIGMVFSKGSLFGKRIGSIIVRCVESGLCDLWITDILGKVPKKGKTLTTRPIILSDVDSAFTILAIGLVMAVLAFVVEITIYNIVNQNSNDYNPWSLDRLKENIVI